MMGALESVQRRRPVQCADRHRGCGKKTKRSLDDGWFVVVFWDSGRNPHYAGFSAYRAGVRASRDEMEVNAAPWRAKARQIADFQCSPKRAKGALRILFSG